MNSNATFLMGMTPIQVWFVCKLCKCSFQKVDEFMVHKKDKHFNEFQKIRCIIFEERTLDQEFSKSFNVENFGTEFTAGGVSQNEENPVNNKTIHSHQYFRQLGGGINQELENLCRQEPSTFVNHNRNGQASNNNNMIPSSTAITVGSSRGYTALPGVLHQSGTGTGTVVAGTGTGVLEELNALRFRLETQSLRTIESDLIVHSQSQVNDNVTFNVSVPVLSRDQSRLNFEISDPIPSQSTFCNNNNPMDNNTSTIKNNSSALPLGLQNVQIKTEIIPANCTPLQNQRTDKKVVCYTFSKLNFDLDPQDVSILIDPDRDSGPSDTFTSPSSSQIVPFQCKLCGTKFDTEQEVRIHIKHCWIHNKQRHRFCILCKKSFFDPFAYRRHILRFHATDEEKANRPKFTCYFCPKEFTEKSSLKKHFLKFHVSSQQSQSNSKSSGDFGSNSGPGSGGKQFICQMCGASFLRQQDLAKHETVHVGDGNSNGNANNFKYQQQSSSNNKNFQPISEDRQFKCTQQNCTKTFTRSYHLTRHMVQKHSEEGDLKKFKCQVCNKMFSTNSLLQNHTSVHTQEKPYKCTHVGCSSAFKRKDVLVQHEKMHTGERPHKCETCGKAFSKRFSYLKHMKIHTNNSYGQQLGGIKYPGS